jgi:small-conductance mechanosensitive channel
LLPLTATIASAQSPVRLQGRALFELKTPTADLSIPEAAALSSARLDRFAADRALSLELLHIDETSDGSAIRAGARLLVLVTNAEAAAHARPRAQLASDWLARIRAATEAYRATDSLHFWSLLVLYLLLYTALFAAALWLLAFLQRKARAAADWYTHRRLAERGSRILSLFSRATLLETLASGLSILRWIVTLVLFNLYLNYVIRLFPGTAEISETLGSYLLSPLYTLGAALLSYLPDLFFVLIVAIVAYYLIRLNNYVFIKIARGAILVEGFYPDWAIPTAKLVRLLIIILALIVAFPYLPGAKSPAFQGISLFIGVLFSLGSSSTISNIINGVILTYMRAFQIGDRVKIADTLGDVIEKNLLVTRLQTIHNEIVTVPNSQIMAAQILNYSALAREGRLLLPATVTIGYDAPWQKVHELLLAAAAATPGVAANPAPFVWQRALNDYNVTYELNVHTADAAGMIDTYSALYANIQDHFNRAGVEIMSPAYTALRDGNSSTIPHAHRAPGYEPPAFRIHPRP